MLFEEICKVVFETLFKSVCKSHHFYDMVLLYQVGWWLLIAPASWVLHTIAKG